MISVRRLIERRPAPQPGQNRNSLVRPWRESTSVTLDSPAMTTKSMNCSSFPRIDADQTGARGVFRRVRSARLSVMRRAMDQ